MADNDKGRAVAEELPFPGELTGSIAPEPTAATVRMRTFLPYQAYRFARVNLRMIKMIRRSHVH